MKRVLAAVDGSSASMRGARLAARIAARFGAELTLLHAVDLDLPATPSGKYKKAVAQLWREHEDAGKKLVEDVTKVVRAHGVPIRTAIVRGSPSKKVPELAESGRFDLVVVGSTGRGGVARRLLGGTADRIARVVKGPVLLVR